MKNYWSGSIKYSSQNKYLYNYYAEIVAAGKLNALYNSMLALSENNEMTSNYAAGAK